MTFLELCQAVARESGTISGTQPVTVTGQSGRLAKVVQWTQQAWRQIQVSHLRDWYFLRRDLPATCLTTAGAARYTPASWGISDLAYFVTDTDSITLYDDSIGAADEGELTRLTWDEWRQMYDRGVQHQNRPTHYAISPGNEFCLGPIPDGVYRVRGRYVRTIQNLVNDDDEPLMPEHYHDLIVWDALRLLAGHDEAPVSYAHVKAERQELWAALCRDQLPPITRAGPLA